MNTSMASFLNPSQTVNQILLKKKKKKCNLHLVFVHFLDYVHTPRCSHPPEDGFLIHCVINVAFAASF